jgi:uncharacterized membrane protein (DUF2068 family)
MDRTGNSARPGPLALDHHSSAVGLRAIATFEALKGIAVIILLFLILGLHNHAEQITESLLFHLHINPDRHAGQALLHAAGRLTDARLWTIMLAALSYAAVRFAEAWGLWNRRIWAEWFSLLSGAMYIPWELLRLIEHTNWEHILVLAINVLIVLYMLWVRIRSHSHTGDVSAP